MSNLEEQFLAKVPVGESKGNFTLKNDLGWEEEQYWRIRGILIDRGELIKGRGKGGSVRRVEKDANVLPLKKTKDIQKPNALTEDYNEEVTLYTPMLKVIKSAWTKEQGMEEGEYFAEITAYQGRKQTGGKWSRPDIVLASKKRYQYFRSSSELTTFEVKTSEGFDVTAIYEALAHRRSAHKSYVLVHSPQEKNREIQEDILDDAEQEALKHGVGLIVCENPSDFGTWDIYVEATRHEPDPERLDSFFKTSSEELKKWLLKNR